MFWLFPKGIIRKQANKHCMHRALLIKEESEISTLTKIHVGFFYVLAKTELEVSYSIMYVLKSWYFHVALM
jgi:hypothetical protein